jgi:hypothetical protein
MAFEIRNYAFFSLRAALHVTQQPVTTTITGTLFAAGSSVQ